MLTKLSKMYFITYRCYSLGSKASYGLITIENRFGVFTHELNWIYFDTGVDLIAYINNTLFLVYNEETLETLSLLKNCIHKEMFKVKFNQLSSK